MSTIINDKVKRKSKNIVFKVLFSRTIITALLLIIQVLILIGCFKWLSHYMTYILSGFSILSFALLVYIINNKSNPAFKLAWVLPLCLFPVPGAILYIFITFNRGQKKLKHRLQVLRDEIDTYSHTEPGLAEAVSKVTSISDVSYYLDKIAGNATYANSPVTYYPLGEDKYKDMIIELEKAKSFIFLEYFIVEEGIMWDTLLEILVRKAKEGVEVRVMYDGMCSLVLLPYSYPQKLKKMGLKAKMYAPIVPFLSTHQNNRDHRKILVIDGKVAFNGGVNLADEYINEREVYGHWKDVAVRVKGDAVQGFTNMFLQMWNVDERTPENYEKYLTVAASEEKTEATGIVIPYGDGPTTGYNIAENIYMDMLYKAKKYVHIMTPYFIVDNEMMTALLYAAERGVDVKLLLPHIADKKTAFDIARTYYPQLLRSGIKIYEYTPGFVHAKLFVCDDERAVVGTINLDFRSLYHHFECGTYLYRHDVIADIEKDYQDTLAKSQRITMEDYQKIPGFHKLCGSVLRMFGSLM